MAEQETKTNNQNNQVQEIEIVDELRHSYINYAMSVIVARALPDVRDGLKPVQRRILYAMHDSGVRPGTSFKKVAKISGEVMGKYHPHGNAAIEDAMVRLAQEWNLRYPLVQGQGNFGSIDGDKHAAARYIEARLHKHSDAMLSDLDKRTVDFEANYDGEESEPSVLPNLLPNLILNGAEGIAVGMATKIPPHNLREVVDALIDSISNGASDYEGTKVDYDKAVKNQDDLNNLPQDRFPTFSSDIEIKDILQHIKGPDFPTGAEIYDWEEIKKVYETGRGRVVMRGVSEVEEAKGGKFNIVITEIPYQVNKTRLITKIAGLVKDGKITGISDIKDLSSRGQIRIVVELKRDAKPKIVENKLYKFTELQKNFSANMLALVDGEPHLLNIKQILTHFLNHRQQVLIRKNEFDLAKKREREHILEGLIIAIDNIDEVIETIRSSKDVDTARTALMKKFDLSEIQAQAILDMQLRRLAALERQKLVDEYEQVKKEIQAILKLLSDPKQVLDNIVTELEELKSKHGDDRRTKLRRGKVGEMSEEDLVANEDVFVTISEQGYIKRLKDNAYQTQNRGGVGKKAMNTKEDDAVRHVFRCTTHDQILVFTNLGRVYSLKVYEVPEYSTRSARGVPMINLINISQGEFPTSVLTRKTDGGIIDEDTSQEHEEDLENQGRQYKFLFMATKNGVVKKTEITQFDSIRSNGLIAINLDSDDELVWVKPTTGESEIMLVTRMAKSILFNEDDVRDTGRATRGVKGIVLKGDNEVIAMDVIRRKEDRVLTVSKKGYGKVTTLDQFPTQKRGGAGVFAAQVSSKTGDLAVARILDHPDQELLIMSSGGQAVRIKTQELPERNRQTQGVRMMKLKGDDEVVAIAII